ncbi:hypothetical protein [Pseudaestuariivita sp.]|uniref:hypothetical protein n=1 Tax=Pseudaestuariivita sp. TaxID=2211669 RepID=UPI004059D3FE
MPRKWARDLINAARFGPAAPLSDDSLIVPLAKVTHRYASAPGHRLRRRHSGRVVGGTWDQARAPLGEDRFTRSFTARFVHGADWEETELFALARRHIAERGKFDDCRSMEDVHARYTRIDRIAAEARLTGRLRAVTELPDVFRREHGGIFMHFDRDGLPLRDGGGQHRFALARVLGLETIPVQVGVVHLEAVRRDLLRPYMEAAAAMLSER